MKADPARSLVASWKDAANGLFTPGKRDEPRCWIFGSRMPFGLPDCPLREPDTSRDCADKAPGRSGFIIVASPFLIGDTCSQPRRAKTTGAKGNTSLTSARIGVAAPLRAIFFRQPRSAQTHARSLCANRTRWPGSDLAKVSHEPPRSLSSSFSTTVSSVSDPALRTAAWTSRAS